MLKSEESIPNSSNISLTFTGIALTLEEVNYCCKEVGSIASVFFGFSLQPEYVGSLGTIWGMSVHATKEDGNRITYYKNTQSIIRIIGQVGIELV